MAIICAKYHFDTQTLKRASCSSCMDHVRVEGRHLQLEAAAARVVSLFAVNSIRLSVEEVISRPRHGPKARGDEVPASLAARCDTPDAK